MNVKSCSTSRRAFIKKGAAEVAGLSMCLPFFHAADIDRGEAKKELRRKIRIRTLGRTGLNVSILGLGAAYPEVTRAALDSGINYLDTAERYGGGSHESMLGEVLKQRPRDSFVITTKILGLRDNRTGLPPKGASPAAFREDFRNKMERSLKRLHVECVDILYLHGVDNPELLEMPMVKDVMLELKEEGKARFLGLSFHHKELELISATVRGKIYDVILTSYNFRQPHREKVKKAIADAADAGFGIVAMKIMAGSYWDKEKRHPVNTKAALKWVLQDENVHTTIPGIETFNQLEMDLSAMEDPKLTSQEKDDLAFGEKYGMAGLYCAQCGRCRSQCRYGLDIPTLMRGYMYAYGYGKPAEAKSLLGKQALRSISCRSCHTCAVNCAMGFDVPAKIKDVIRILDVPDEFLA
jgi:predicted aldo/keto reductase-like oxidoreductase